MFSAKFKWLINSLVIFSLISTIGLVSCNKEEAVVLTGSIQLSINDLALLSDDLQMDAGFYKPSAVFLTIKDASGKVVINNKKYDLIKVNTDYLTDSILLKEGLYSIDKLGVVSEDSTLMYITPRSGSDFGESVRTPLSHSFAIDGNKSELLIMDVLPVTLGSLEQFGISSTEFNVISVMTLQPDSISGKDAFAHSLYPDTNYGRRDMLESLAWIFTGPQIILRSYFDFETSSLPVGTEIVKATLSLYEFHTSIVPSGGHYHYKGSNASYIQRVTSPWSENLMTWNNQPTYISTNRVTLQQDTSYNQDYSNIDMTSLIQDLVNLSVNERYGFVLSLINETGYRAMIFGSSDTADKTKRPKLVVTYKK